MRVRPSGWQVEEKTQRKRTLKVNSNSLVVDTTFASHRFLSLWHAISALDGQPVRFFITIVTGIKASKEYLQVLASFCAIGRDPVRREKVLSAGSPQELCKIIKSFNIALEH